MPRRFLPQRSSREGRQRALVEQGVARALAAAAPDGGSIVLAVSGGRDSMAMMHACAAMARERIAAVATFDHGTGAWARHAVEFVRGEAAALGLPVEAGAASQPLAGEAAWRAARWEFLRACAGAHGARVATAHTRDDQVETIVIRVLRGAGARGLAGLYAPGDVLRPLLALARAEVAGYLAAQRLPWLEDPANHSPAYLRNRVRHDLLPALEAARPGLGDGLLALAREAAAVRAAVDAVIARAVPARIAPGSVHVAQEALAPYDASALALLWPALAAGAGVVLDRRGTSRLAEFTITGREGGRVQVAGGLEVVRSRGMLQLRPVRMLPALASVQPLGPALRLGPWTFRRLEESAGGGLWDAMLPVGSPLGVRSWRPGDRMTPAGASAPRRVKGLLRDAGLDAGARRGWPVVLAAEEIVWIPGVRRSAAATARPGRPAMRYLCERAAD